MNRYDCILDQQIVPLQPELRRSTLNYQEKCLCWNPISKKNQTLFYQFQTGEDPEQVIQIIPDACADFMFSCSGNSVGQISGVWSHPRKLVLEPLTTYFGFKPYTTKGIRKLRLAWNELAGECVPMGDQLDCEALSEALVEGDSFETRISAFQHYALTNLIDHSYVSDFVEFSEIQLCGAMGNIKIDAISGITGYTSRYCREKFKAAHGISIKSYSDIIRFQNAVRMLANTNVGCALDIVHDNGYFDQSHLIRDFKRFSQGTPSQFKRLYF